MSDPKFGSVKYFAQGRIAVYINPTKLCHDHQETGLLGLLGCERD